MDFKILELKAYNQKALSHIYSTHPKTFAAWIKRLKPKVGTVTRVMTPLQQLIIFKELGPPNGYLFSEEILSKIERL